MQVHVAEARGDLPFGSKVVWSKWVGSMWIGMEM